MAFLLALGGQETPVATALGSPRPITTVLEDADFWTSSTENDRTFLAPIGVPVGESPSGVVAADLNADGRPDVVTANAGSGDVSLVRGGGDGSFGRAQSFPIRINDFSPDLRSVAAGDLNGDGFPDLVTGCGSPCGGYIFVLLGQGEGAFAMPLAFFAGRGPVSVAIGDLDRDGFADLAAAVRFNDLVAVLLGHGDGTVADRRHFDVSGAPRGVAVADLNSDDLLDIVVAAGDLAVLLGAGDGTFAAEQRFGAGGAASAVAVQDVNSDGVADVVTANGDSDDVSVLLGRGDGTLATRKFFPVGRQPSAVAVGDLNRDGRLDIVTANSESDDVALLIGRGDGTFALPESFRVGDGPRSLAVADLNRDGRPDIVTANSLSDDVSVLLAAGPPICPGDCDGNGAVTVDEILRAVNVALGSTPLTACAAADRDGEGTVTIDELVVAVDAALEGCPVPGGNTKPGVATTLASSAPRRVGHCRDSRFGHCKGDEVFIGRSG